MNIIKLETEENKNKNFGSSSILRHADYTTFIATMNVISPNFAKKRRLELSLEFLTSSTNS